MSERTQPGNLVPGRRRGRVWLVVGAVVLVMAALYWLQARRDGATSSQERLDGVDVSLVCSETPDSERAPTTVVGPGSWPTFDWEEGRRIGATIGVTNRGSEPIRVRGFSTAWDGPLAASSPISIRFAVVESSGRECDGWESVETPTSRRIRVNVPTGETAYFKFSITLGHCSDIDGDSSLGSTTDVVHASIERDGSLHELPAGPWPDLMFRFRPNQCPRSH